MAPDFTNPCARPAGMTEAQLIEAGERLFSMAHAHAREHNCRWSVACLAVKKRFGAGAVAAMQAASKALANRSLQERLAAAQADPTE